MNGIAQINGHKKLIFYDEFNKNTESLFKFYLITS